MNRTRPFWTFVAALIVSCGCCQTVRSYSPESLTRDKIPGSLRAIHREDVNHEKENIDSLEEWDIENELNPSQDTPVGIRHTQAVTTQTQTTRHDRFFEVYEKRNKIRNGTIWEDGNVLSNYKYVIFPYWWNDTNLTDPAFAQHDIDHVHLNRTIEYFQNMSFGHFDLSFEVLPPVVLNVSEADKPNTCLKCQATRYAQTLGHEKGVTYKGVVLLKAGPGSGGVATLGGSTITVPKTNYRVLRHEIGHNMGHNHWKAVYHWRRNRGKAEDDEADIVKDGFTMMGGGNNYNYGDFLPESKSFWNWIPRSSIVLLQPEGSTEKCPECRDGGTYTIHTFDNPDLPPQENQAMGITIPVMNQFTNKRDDRYYLYSLSYRTGIDDGLASGGLAIHLAWFTLASWSGAKYDSARYDAFGKTKHKFDAFVLPGTCYVIHPLIKLLDLNPTFAKQVIPQVCVDSVNVGSDITVTVSFLDSDLIFEPSTRAVQPDQEFECSFDGQASVTQSMTAGSSALIHVTNTGYDGKVYGDFCETNDTAVYIYDHYPLLPLTLASTPPEYGAFPAFPDPDTKKKNNNCFGKTLTGEAWVWLKGSTDAEISLSCEMTSCYHNQYRSGNTCVQCPNNLASPKNSIDISACTKCPDGFNLTDSRQKFCSVSEDYDDSIATSKGWRIWTTQEFTSNLSKCSVENIKMYPTSDCSGSEYRIDISNVTFVESGHNGGKNGPENAFKDSDMWDGRKDENDVFYIGLMFDQELTVRCMRIEFGEHSMTEIRVQAFVESENEWKNAWIQKNVNLVDGLINVGVGANLITCGQNQYSSDDKCMQCPSNTIAPPGSTDIADCQTCLDGFIITDPQATECSLSEDFDQSITSSGGWRIWCPAELATKATSVQVENVKMYPTSDCTGNEVVIDLADVTLVHSGSAPQKTPDLAFQEKDRWGGKPDDDGLFYLGVMFNQHVTVRCMRIKFGNKYMTEIRVQAFIESEDKWENVHIEKGITGGKIDVGWITVNSPTMQPSKSPTLQPFSTEQNELFDIDPAAVAKLFLNFFLEFLWQLLVSFSDAARRLFV